MTAPGRGPRLDAWRNPDTDVRIAIDAWHVRAPISDQFIARPKSMRMVWNYLRRIGPTAVWRKIRSRLAEEGRNIKVAGVGTGRVLESPAGCAVAPGQRVVFFAPNHSPDWPRISLDARLIQPTKTAAATVALKTSQLEFPESLRGIAAWSPYSGHSLDTKLVQRELSRIVSWLSLAAGGADAPANSVGADTTVAERIDAEPGESGNKTAVVFGLGNYAKTQIIPHLRRHLHLAAVHEIDPDQIGAATGFGATLDTSPWPRDGEHYDAWFIAGFHESHAALAIRALDDGAYAVVEKPLVTTRAQFAALNHAMTGAAARRLFTCFHKRYSQLHDWALIDLGVGRGDPVDMHCIVYEIPLPLLHWYNWPSSGSRLISNGCHWLDYFLYVNDYSPVADGDVRPMRGSDLVAFVKLENGAQLAMSLTDTGSQRLGVRDVIDLRAEDVTVRLIDATYYDAENSSRVLRRRRVNPMTAYATMYDTICRRVAAGQDGDRLESLRSTALMLDLEDELQRKRHNPRPLETKRGTLTESLHQTE